MVRAADPPWPPIGHHRSLTTKRGRSRRSDGGSLLFVGLREEKIMAIKPKSLAVCHLIAAPLMLERPPPLEWLPIDPCQPLQATYKRRARRLPPALIFFIFYFYFFVGLREEWPPLAINPRSPTFFFAQVVVIAGCRWHHLATRWEEKWLGKIKTLYLFFFYGLISLEPWLLLFPR